LGINWCFDYGKAEGKSREGNLRIQGKAALFFLKRDQNAS